MKLRIFLVEGLEKRENTRKSQGTGMLPSGSKRMQQQYNMARP